MSQVAVRPVRDAVERSQWDRLMDERHYLGFRGMFGDGLRHVAAGPDGRWLALVGWCAGAFKVGARDAWIGWAPAQETPPESEEDDGSGGDGMVVHLVTSRSQVIRTGPGRDHVRILHNEGGSIIFGQGGDDILEGNGETTSFTAVLASTFWLAALATTG